MGHLGISGTGVSSGSRTYRSSVPATSLTIQQQTRFLSITDLSNSHALKRSVLASLTAALLLPMRLVPRAVGGGTRAFGARFNTGIAGIGAEMGVSGNAAAQGLGMLSQGKSGGTQDVSSSGNGGVACKTDFESGDAISRWGTVRIMIQ
jgi:hypothetical protein